MSQVNAAIGAIKLVARLISRQAKKGNTDSIVSFTRSMRVEPITMIDSRLATLSYMPDIMQSMNAMFSAYYLQAIAAMTRVRDINVIRVMEQLNPNRDVSNAMGAHIVDHVNNASKAMGYESFTTGLPSYRPTDFNLEAFTARNMRHAGVSTKLGLEAFGFVDTANKVASGDYDGVDTSVSDPIDNRMHGGKSITALKEAVNLSVGRILEVQIGNPNDGGGIFPVAVRLIATFMDPSVLVHILGDGSRNNTFKERFHSWRSGQIEFWRDLVLAQDLIDAHKAALVKDKSGVYQEIMDRRAGNAAAATISGDPSIGTASNIILLSKRTVQELERSVGGRFDNPQTRARIFKSNYAMITGVVDHEREIIDIYIRGVNIPSRISVREMKQVNKSGGLDVGEVFKALMENRAPQF